MHIIFDTNSLTLNDFTQIGSGYAYFEGISPYQRTRQRGDGVGAILKSLYRMLLPLAKTAGKTVGKEGLATAGRILSDLAQGSPFRDTVVAEAKTGVKNLVEKMNHQAGSGIKRMKAKKKTHLKAIAPSAIIKRRRSDAFGLY